MGGVQCSSVRADGAIVLRTPLLPMTMLLEWADGDARRYLASLVDLPEVREALYVASPDLSAALDAWRAAPTSSTGARIEHALVKYVARMMGRATPFGLFAGVSVGTLGRATVLELGPRSEYRRFTRLDNDYLFALTRELARLPEARAALRYRPNSSLYRIAGHVRCAVARLVGKERTHHLISVDATPYLTSALARADSGATRDELANAIVGGDIALDDARAYIDELIDAQLLVPELDVQITGAEPIDGVLQQLAATPLAQPRSILDGARASMRVLDARGLGNGPQAYEAITETLRALPGSVDSAHLFQVDMVKPARVTLAPRVAADVARAIEQLARITPARDPFRDFKHAFRERWAERAVPVAEVLDEESGIGFETHGGPDTAGEPLLAGLRFPTPARDDRTPWTRYHEHLLRRLTTAVAAGHREIVLDHTDMAAMQAPDPVVLPDSFGALLRLAARRDGGVQILLENTSGPSASRLLGRFCHASSELHAHVLEHHAREQARRPHAVIAEIVHLNEGRIGNIVCRPVLRSHEIVYLGRSGAPPECQLRIDDLLVAVRGDRVVLTSRSLGREVLPRLATAHNFRLRSLPVYRFLCALAEQQDGRLAWRWGALEAAAFLPRVTLDDVVLSRAVWNLDEHDVAPIADAVRATRNRPGESRVLVDVVAALRRHRGLPRMLTIGEGDHELPIDLDNPLLAATFARELIRARRPKLRELFPSPDELVASGPEGGYANEIVLMFSRLTASDVAARAVETAPPASPIRRELLPGSEWLYAKIYCGEATADRVLREVVSPVVRTALAAGDAQSWFFVRYRDPEPHLRLRLRGEPSRLLANVVPLLHHALAPLVEVGAVARVALDTYVREIERYGGPRAIELVEELFWHDSEAVLGIVDLLDGDAGADARWKLAVRGVDSLLTALGLAASERAAIAQHGRDSLGRELHADRELWASIGSRFASERAELERIVAGDVEHELQPGFELLARRDAAIAPLGAALSQLEASGELSPRLHELAWSLVHMHVNRMLRGAHRTQELVLYDFIRRLHASRLARSSR